jgi:hypothetical protein
MFVDGNDDGNSGLSDFIRVSHQCLGLEFHRLT